MQAVMQPIAFTTGQFASQCMRFELVEIQKPEIGRRHIPGDGRRLLDPPPVVRLKIFRVHAPGTPSQSETELNNETIEVEGLMCSIDLFPVPESTLALGITETSKKTGFLAGASCVQPLLVDYQGFKNLLFTTGDLAVKVEGTFLLRYRLFDLFSTPAVQPNDLGYVAECYGAPFKVYSKLTWPGFGVSTELTKCLAQSGASVKVRTKDRIRTSMAVKGGRN